jgi:hypothetical protein
LLKNEEELNEREREKLEEVSEVSWLFRHRHGKEVLSEETGRGKEVIERREVFDMQGIG